MQNAPQSGSVPAAELSIMTITPIKRSTLWEGVDCFELAFDSGEYAYVSESQLLNYRRAQAAILQSTESITNALQPSSCAIRPTPGAASSLNTSSSRKLFLIVSRTARARMSASTCADGGAESTTGFFAPAERGRGMTISTNASGVEQARCQLFHLYQDWDKGEFLERRCLDCSVTPSRTGPRAFHRSINELVDAAMHDAAEGWDVFFGVGLRRCPKSLEISRCRCEHKGADHVSRLPAIWADLDVKCEDEPNKPHTSIESIRAMLAESPQKPTMLIGSGMGVHAYWKLPGGPTADLDRVVALNRAIRDRFKGDDVIDAARISDWRGLRITSTVRPCQ